MVYKFAKYPDETLVVFSECIPFLSFIITNNL